MTRGVRLNTVVEKVLVTSTCVLAITFVNLHRGHPHANAMLVLAFVMRNAIKLVVVQNVQVNTMKVWGYVTLLVQPTYVIANMYAAELYGISIIASSMS